MADRETIVETGSGGPGILVAVVLAVLVILSIVYFMNNGGVRSGTVDVDVPAVTVSVKPDGQ